VSASRRRTTGTRRTRAPALGVGWRTSDEDEVERRRRRAAEEAIAFKPLERGQPFFGAFAAASAGGEAYRVEIRSLAERINSCACRDFAVNGLGTCKHVEAVLAGLARRRGRVAAQRAGSTRIEVFLDRRDGVVRVRWPADARRGGAARELIAPHFSGEGTLLGDPLDAWPALAQAVAAAPERTRVHIRLSDHVTSWLDDRRRHADGPLARAAFESDVAAGRYSVSPLRATLYPYQIDGMLHLAFTGRALLADEMGLGKTVQAIAACALLRRLRGIERVLIVCPASLKGEWEDQIAKFTDLPAHIVQGPRAARLRQYRTAAFFYLVNYEQVLADRGAINELLAPDVVVLDEAQRIKNWQSKTAREVKRLLSPYAFVLTGTPLENRIDEIYSIVEMLDPHLLGPLFRFNREFYQLDDRGHAAGYRNLDELHRRLRPVMLRRRKDDVEDELPPRTVNNYFVPMHPEQRVRYEEYESKVARLAAQARRRPLKPEEWERLQRALACMRMLCDTPYILDPECRIAPKLDEIEAVLHEIAQGDRKAILFSEWVRMLDLIAERVEAAGLGYAVHTGQVPLRERREGVRRFQRDPACRVLLASDAGAVGLNLQAASVVVNVDLPWNPARLEQRIARAWRKHQVRAVQVVNIVTEDSIEHRMLDLLEQKRALAAEVVDGAQTASEMALPSGRKALIERVHALMTPQQVAPVPVRAPPPGPEQRLRDDLHTHLGGAMRHLAVAAANGAPARVFAVLDQAHDAARTAVAAAAKAHLGVDPQQVETIDEQTWAVVRRLIAAGVLAPGPHAGHTLHDAAAAQDKDDARQRARDAAHRLAGESARKQRMAQVLASGGFAAEAIMPLRGALEDALCALAHLHAIPADGALAIDQVPPLLAAAGLAPEGAALLARLRTGEAPADDGAARALLDAGAAVLRAAGDAVAQAQG